MFGNCLSNPNFQKELKAACGTHIVPVVIVELLLGPSPQMLFPCAPHWFLSQLAVSVTPPCNFCGFAHCAIHIRNGAFSEKMGFPDSVLTPQTKYRFSKFKAMVARQVNLLAHGLEYT